MLTAALLGAWLFVFLSLREVAVVASLLLPFVGRVLLPFAMLAYSTCLWSDISALTKLPHISATISQAFWASYGTPTDTTK